MLQKLALENELDPALDLEHRVIFQDPTILPVAQLLRAEAMSGRLAGNLYGGVAAESAGSPFAAESYPSHLTAQFRQSVEMTPKQFHEQV